jgi:hypothetical protein
MTAYDTKAWHYDLSAAFQFVAELSRLIGARLPEAKVRVDSHNVEYGYSIWYSVEVSTSERCRITYTHHFYVENLGAAKYLNAEASMIVDAFAESVKKIIDSKGKV